MGINDLAKRAEAGLKQAGAMPQMFGTITISDGISMGTEGMKYSLVSREVIADSIETVLGFSPPASSAHLNLLDLTSVRRGEKDSVHQYDIYVK